MEYRISPVEITRRKKAYCTLVVSLLIGVIGASTLLSVSVSLGGYALISIILFLLGAFAFHFFRTLSQTRITVSNQSLNKIVNGISETYALHQIKRVQIKWTTRNTIREIYILLSDGTSVFLTAVNNFEQLKKELLDALDKNTSIKETHEAIDFDHPLFYSLLGLPISTIGILFFKKAANFQYAYLKIGGIAFVVYLVLFSLYFILAKPISKRSGNTTKSSDYIMAGVLGSAAIGILFIFLRK